MKLNQVEYNSLCKDSFLGAISEKTPSMEVFGRVSSPVANVTKPIEPPGRVRFLSEEERERLLAACQESDKAT